MEPSGIRLGVLREPPGCFLETLWKPSGSLLVGPFGSSLEGFWKVSGSLLGPLWEPSGDWGLLGACLGPAWGPAWGLLGACLGPAWSLLGAGHLLGANHLAGACLGPCLRPCLGPSAGPGALEIANPPGRAGRASKTLGFRVFTFVCCLHQVWLFVALPWQGWKRPSFTWAYA